MSTLEHAKANAPWYVSALATAIATAREVLRSDPKCAVHSIEDLEAIMRIAQGFSG